MLEGQIERIIKENTIGSVASVSPEGEPCVSPKGMFLIWDKRTLVFANVRSPKTVFNLTHNPKVEVCFTDIFHRVGCRVFGRAEIIEKSDPTFAVYQKRFEVLWPPLCPLVQSYVVIDVERAEFLTSPVYDIHMTVAELERKWLRYYTELYGGEDGV